MGEQKTPFILTICFCFYPVRSIFLGAHIHNPKCFDKQKTLFNNNNSGHEPLQQLMHAIVMVHKMQRMMGASSLAGSGNNPDSRRPSKEAPTPAPSPAPTGPGAPTGATPAMSSQSGSSPTAGQKESGAKVSTPTKVPPVGHSVMKEIVSAPPPPPPRTGSVPLPPAATAAKSAAATSAASASTAQQTTAATTGRR